MIKTSLAESTEELSKQVAASVEAADQKIDGSLKDTDKEVKQAVADNSKCSLAVYALSGTKSCVAAPWVVACAADLACTTANAGGLRFDKSTDQILLCSSNKEWVAVSPPSVGAFESTGRLAATSSKKLASTPEASFGTSTCTHAPVVWSR